MIPLFLALACAPDDVTDDTGSPADTAETGDTGDTTDTGDTQDTGAGGSIVGDWLSEGANIAPLLSGAPFNYVSIDAHFDADLSYEVVATNADGQTGTLTGTYVASDATTPGTITLSQATPYTATAEGIWQIDGSTLTYEVVQVDPSYGFTPPTPESGFGTTAGDGIEPGENVQVYVRQ